MNIQGWFSLGLTDLICLQSKGLSRAFSNTTIQKFNSLVLSLLYSPILTSLHDYCKVMSLLFYTLSRFIIAFLPRSKCLLTSWLQSQSAVILGPKKIKSVTVSPFPPSICYEVMGPDTMILVFWMLSFKPAFSLSSNSKLDSAGLCLWRCFFGRKIFGKLQDSWWLSWLRVCLWCRRPGFDRWVGKIPLEEGMAIHSSIFEPGESHGHRSRWGYSP